MGALYPDILSSRKDRDSVWVCLAKSRVPAAANVTDAADDDAVRGRIENDRHGVDRLRIVSSIIADTGNCILMLN